MTVKQSFVIIAHRLNSIATSDSMIISLQEDHHHLRMVTLQRPCPMNKVEKALSTLYIFIPLYVLSMNSFSLTS